MRPKGMAMLTTKEAMEKRRSIRKFRPDPVPDECIRVAGIRQNGTLGLQCTAMAL